MNRKGQVFDIIPYLAFLLIFAMCSVIGLTVYRAYSDKVSDKFDAEALDVVTTAGEVYTALDSAYLFVVAALIIGLIATAFFIQTHPAFFVINLVMLMIVIIVAAPLSDVFSKFQEGSASNSYNLTDSAVDLPYTSALSVNFPLIALVAGAVFFIALYAKVRYA